MGPGLNRDLCKDSLAALYQQIDHGNQECNGQKSQPEFKIPYNTT